MFLVRWNADEANMVFLVQAGYLAAMHYSVQIAVHRPSISTKVRSPLALPAIVICTNAARSCVRMVDCVFERLGSPSHHTAVSMLVLTLPSSFLISSFISERLIHVCGYTSHQYLW